MFNTTEGCLQYLYLVFLVDRSPLFVCHVTLIEHIRNMIYNPTLDRDL